MKIGLTYDLRADYLAAGYGEEETAEFDRPDTIEAIEAALLELGYRTDRSGNAKRLVERFGAEVDELPLGAIGVYTFCQKLKVGLQQLMAGARKFNPSAIAREDVIALTEEAAKVSGLSYVMDAYREEAELILNG